MTDTTADQARSAGVYAGEVAARLDRLPFTRTLWRFVTLISLGGIFELYDLFMTAYISPGLIRSGLFSASAPSFISAQVVGAVLAFGLIKLLYPGITSAEASDIIVAHHSDPTA